MGITFIFAFVSSQTNCQGTAPLALNLYVESNVRTVVVSLVVRGVFSGVAVLFARTEAGSFGDKIAAATSLSEDVSRGIPRTVLSVATRVVVRCVELGNSNGVTTMTIAVSTKAKKKRLFIFMK